MENQSSDTNPVSADPADGASLPPTEREQTPPAPPHIDPRREGLIACGVVALYLLFWQVALRLPTSGIASVGVTTLIYLALTLLFTVQLARALRSSASIAISLLVSAVLSLPGIMLPMLAPRFPWSGWEAVANAYGFFGAHFLRPLPGLHGLLLIWFAACLGVALSRLVRETKIILPMSVALACVDIYVVFGGGLVAQAESGKAPVARAAMQALTVKMPATTSHAGAAPMQLAVGFADYLFVALFFACFARFGIPSKRTFQVLCVTLVVYMLYVAFSGSAMPALVPIAVVVILMNLRQFRYSRSEAFALLYAGLIVAVAMGGLLLVSHR